MFLAWRCCRLVGLFCAGLPLSKRGMGTGEADSCCLEGSGPEESLG